jgi:hypothetical protein
MKIARLFGLCFTALALALFIIVNIEYFHNLDLLSPVIEIDSPEITVSINDPVTQVMSGVKASDSKDGDVTDLMVIKGISNFTELDKRTVNYVAFDKDGNYSEAQRTMVYSDYTKPKFEFTDALKFPIGATDTDILSKVVVCDCLDGDISNNITFTNNSMVNSSTPGKYKVDLSITNSAGDTQELPVTVEIFNSLFQNITPEIHLNKYLVYTGLGEKLNLEDMIKDVLYRGQTYSITEEEGTFGIDTSDFTKYQWETFRERDASVNIDKIKITSYINYQVPGVYEVVYELKDLEENLGSVILTVVVEDYE